MPTPEELQQDHDFMSATPADQIKYLSETDPDFKAAHPDDQAAYLAHVTKQPTGEEAMKPKPGITGKLDTATDYISRSLEPVDKAVTEALAPKPTGDIIPTETREVPKAAARNIYGTGKAALKTLTGLPSALGHAFGDEATPEEKAQYAEFEKQHGEAPGTETSGLKRIGLGVQRFLGADQLKNAVDTYSNPATRPTAEQALSVAEPALQEGAGTVLGMEAAGKLAAIPSRENMPYTSEKIAQGVRGLGKAYQVARANAPEAGAIVGGAAGALKGPGGAAYGTYTGGRVGKILQQYTPEGRAMAEFGLPVEERNIQRLENAAKVADKAAKKAEEDHSVYAASEERGPIDPDVNPAYKKSMEALNKAKAAQAEAHYHLQEAKRAAQEAAANRGAIEGQGKEITPEEVAAARPEPATATPTDEELKTRQEKLMSDIEKKAGVEKPAATPENVKLPGQVQPETVPQEPVAAPRVDETTQMRPLAGNKGVIVGRPPRLLTEGAPEAASAAPEAPKPPLGEILPPEKPAKPGRLGSLKAEGGKVVDVEPEVQQKIEEGLQKGSKEAKPVALKPLGTMEEREPLGGKIGTPESVAEAPKAEAPKEAPKKVEEKTEVSPEDVSKVKRLIADHTDQELLREAQRRGIDESQYDLSKRDERRHRVDRDRLVNDITDKIPDDEKSKLAGLADKFDSKDDTTWTDAEKSNLSRAGRARAIMQEHQGGPKTVSGGAPNEHEAAVTEGGGKYRGVQEGVPEADLKPLVLFDHPETGSTLALPADEVTPEAVKNRLESHKADWDAKYAKKTEPEGVYHTEPESDVEMVRRGINVPEKSERGFSPVDNAEYFKAVKESPSAATLTAPEDMKNNKAYKSDEGVYYSLDPKGDIQAVVNNSPSVWNLVSAIQDAVSNGGKTLDAWDLVLPKFYESIGFENTEHVPYDEKTYGSPSEDLKKAWEQQGWKEGQPYPGVQHMKVSDDLLKEFGPKEAEPLKSVKDMTEAEKEELASKGQAGGSGKEEKPMPTGDQLIKKYGESSGDPAHTAFILPDGRGVALGAVDHDTMLGGKATDKVPRRDQFVDNGNIRIRPRVGRGGREFSISIPESGITENQLAHLNKMAPQLSSGNVMVEIGKRGGAYKEIPYGKASTELESTLRELAPVKEAEKPLGELAEKHLTPEERQGVTKSPQQQAKFIQRMEQMPEVQEWTDAAQKGVGERKWYQRSTQAFDAMSKEAPEYFDQPGDRDKFIGMLAAGSPQQSVAMNMREALKVWTNYVDNGRPTGPKLEKLLSQPSEKGGFTLPGAKIPNTMKALAGEPLWPDITKNKNFKVPSFRDNLTGMLDRVTNDGWMALFAGLDAKDVSSAHSYHPISVMTRAAAEELGWKPAEAQAAIWAFIKTLTEKGVEASEDPHEMRRYSEDFADIILHDPETRALLQDMGVDHAKLDERLAREVEQKPEPESGRTSATAEDSSRRAVERVEKARGKGTIPPPKTGFLKFGEPEPDEATSFEPTKFETGETPKQLAKNASGESSASQEAINRAKSEKSKGIKRYRITAGGGKVPLIGIDAVDVQPGPREHIISVDKDGNVDIIASGNKAGRLPRIKF